MDLIQIAESRELTAEHIAARTAQIHAALLKQSKYVTSPNFASIHVSDLRMLFAEYDARFFDGQIQYRLGPIPLELAFSRRMTSAGGRTISSIDRQTGRRHYEIAVSSTLLYGCFAADDHRPIEVCGVVCRDRLDALQRVLEHELVHLVEMLLWEQSHCAQERFQSISRRLFGHTDFRHRLITARERAHARYGIRPGLKVRFRFDGVEYTGYVNRVNKRATVLVEDPAGQRYNNGKHYRKFFVPAQLLEAVE